jgi:predicted nuclease of predicted toxin-antitoxin system
VKLLLDQGLPRSAVPELRGLGFEATHVGEIGMATAADAAIVERARRERETVVTLDADFHTLVALSNANAPSIVRVRIEGLRGPELAALTVRVIRVCEADLVAGAMVTVDEHSVRVRALPLVR